MQHFLKIGKLLENGTVKFESSKKVRKFKEKQVRKYKKVQSLSLTQIPICNPGHGAM